VVGHEPLEVADAERLMLLAQDAAALALRLLRADAAGDGRQDVVLADLGRRRQVVALTDEPDELADVDVDRAAVLAPRLGALQAALRLGGRPQDGQARVDLPEVVPPLLGRLLRHRLPGDLHPLLGQQLLLRHDTVSTGTLTSGWAASSWHAWRGSRASSWGWS